MNLYVGRIGVVDNSTQKAKKIKVIDTAQTVADFKRKAFNAVRNEFPSYKIDERESYLTALQGELYIGSAGFRNYLFEQ